MTAEPPLKVESREELVYLLGEACEIEHGLMCEYLYAQFSLRRTADEGLTPEQLARVQAWEATLIDVIKQEMLHLALATNILTAIGAEGFAAQPDIQPLASIDRPVAAVPEPWQTVGHLYRGIEAGLAQLCGRYGEEAVFIGPPGAQAVTATFEWKELAAVTGLASASRAIELIVEQGEGARGDWVESHFGKFAGILEDFLAVQAADPGFDPARPVEPAYVRLPPDVESGTLIEDRVTARVADLGNGLYEVMLQVLSRYYVHHGETPAELETLARTAKHLMNWVMRPLGSVLTSLPIGPSHPGRTAGTALEIVRPAYFVPPHREPAWKIISERLDVLTETCAALAQEPGLSTLGDLAAKLRSMAGDARKHLDERASAASGV